MRLLKCSEISKINSVTATECYGEGRNADHNGQCGPLRFARKLFFDSLSLLSKSHEVYALSYRVNFMRNALVFFQAIGFLEVIRAEMIVQAVWAWRPGRLRSVIMTILSLAGGNCWML